MSLLGISDLGMDSSLAAVVCSELLTLGARLNASLRGIGLLRIV